MAVRSRTSVVCTTRKGSAGCMVCHMRKLAEKESVETRSRPGQVATQDRHMSYTKDAANDVARGYRTCWHWVQSICQKT
jgi:hypothetical protein